MSSKCLSLLRKQKKDQLCAPNGSYDLDSNVAERVGNQKLIVPGCPWLLTVNTWIDIPKLYI